MHLQISDLITIYLLVFYANNNGINFVSFEFLHILHNDLSASSDIKTFASIDFFNNTWKMISIS
jgi:hypothetical protein